MLIINSFAKNTTGDHKAFWIPANYDSNEYPYTTSKLSEVNAWKFPIISSGTYQTNAYYINETIDKWCGSCR